MSKCRFLFAILLMAFAGTVPAKPVVRIVSWNLKWFPGGSPEANEEQKKSQMAAAQAVIKSLNPDIFLMQEVADFDAAEQLVSVLDGFKVDVTSRFPGRPQNVVIASRFPADSAWSEEWKRTGIDDPPRGFAFAAIRLPDNRLLLTYSVHLKSNLGDMGEDMAMRQEAVRQLLPHAQAMLELYSKRAETALIIGGDFNTSIDGEKFKSERTLPALRDAGLFWTHEGVPPSQRITIPGSGGHPADTFDHIFLAGLGKPLAKVVQIENVSDHNPVILDFDVSTRSSVAIDITKAKLPRSEITPIKVVSASGGLTYSASDSAKLAPLDGKKVTVRGVVSSIARVGMGSIALVNFEGTQKGDFAVVVKGANIREIGLAHGGSLAQLRRREVEVTGTVTSYKGEPQIELTSPNQLRVTR